MIYNFYLKHFSIWLFLIIFRKNNWSLRQCLRYAQHIAAQSAHQHLDIIFWTLQPIHKLPSGSYSYRHTELSFFSKFHQFSHHLTTKIRPQTALILWWILSMEQPCKMCHTILSLLRRQWKRTGRKWGKIHVVYIRQFFSAANNTFGINKIALNFFNCPRSDLLSFP